MVCQPCIVILYAVFSFFFNGPLSCEPIVLLDEIVFSGWNWGEEWERVRR